MIDLTWTIEDETDRESELTGAPRPLLGTWHYLRSALRRRWRAWGAVAAVGMLLGGIALVLLPPAHRATVTVLMVHPANLDPESAMGTDVSLLNTREIARRTVAQPANRLRSDFPGKSGTRNRSVPNYPEIRSVPVVSG